MRHWLHEHSIAVLVVIVSSMIVLDVLLLMSDPMRKTIP